MKTSDLQKAIKMAKASIYDGAEYIGEWNGYVVYEPIFDDDEPHYIGFPEFILEKSGEFRWTKDDEWSDILDHFNHNNED